jgi:hypothetical protein
MGSADPASQAACGLAEMFAPKLSKVAVSRDGVARMFEQTRTPAP